MEQWKIKLEKKARKDLAKIPEQYRKKVLVALAVLEDNPHVGKRLEGDMADLRSYRVWPYRIIYREVKKFLVIIVIRIGHRQGVYK